MHSCCESIVLREDSVFTLRSSYEVLRDRYNKLRNEYRRLLQCKTCCRCASHIERRADAPVEHLRLDIGRSVNLPKYQSFQSCPSPEAAELIRDVTNIHERLTKVLNSPTSDSDRLSLNDAFDRLFDFQRQMSVSCNSSRKKESNFAGMSYLNQTSSVFKGTVASQHICLVCAYR